MMNLVSSRRARRRLRSKAGFTLLEILIVIAIIGLLVTVVGIQLQRVLDGAKVDTVGAQIRGLKAALDTMQIQIGRYPDENEGLALLVQPPSDVPGWNGPYLDNELPKDPWGADYYYIAPTGDAAPQIGSYGKDGQEGGTGFAEDIVR